MGQKKTIVERKSLSDFQLRSSPALFTPKNNRFIMERVPLRWIFEGRITESDLALAATTPVLGQYAPTFGWASLRITEGKTTRVGIGSGPLIRVPKYLDAYIFVPEAAFAVKLKTRQVWTLSTVPPH